MCELFAINAKRPVRANDLLERFYQDSVWHPHGWGLSWRSGESVHLHKEGIRAIDSSYLRQVLAEPVEATRVVAHIRNATMGVLSYENSHPFVLADVSGRTWTIAHNGTVFDNHLTGSYASQAKGSTDSERLALYLVDQMGEAARSADGPLMFDQRFSKLSKLVTEVSPNNKINLLIDDGEYTYVHTNTVGPTLYERVVGDMTVVCTTPQDESGEWREVPKNRLVAYKDGCKVREGIPHEYSIDDEAYLGAVSQL